jgi:hypothetical protein
MLSSTIHDDSILPRFYASIASGVQACVLQDGYTHTHARTSMHILTCACPVEMTYAYVLICQHWAAMPWIERNLRSAFKSICIYVCMLIFQHWAAMPWIERDLQSAFRSTCMYVCMYVDLLVLHRHAMDERNLGEGYVCMYVCLYVNVRKYT